MTRPPIALAFLLAICACAMLCAPRAYSQTLNVIYNFQNSPDGANPQAGVIFDAQGNLYGATQHGGALECDGLHGCGIVFQLTPNSDGRWTENPLAQFGSPGSPIAPVVFDRLGNLYGSAACTFDCFGSAGGGIYQAAHGSNGAWTINTLVDFSFANNECEDGNCGVAFDSAGRLYATSYEYQGQFGNTGAVFYIGRRSITGWYPINIYTFRGAPDGAGPANWFSIDANDNIYGTTVHGGPVNGGTVFMLQNVGGAQWRETQLYAFQGGSDGGGPSGGVIFDSAGNLYGTTEFGGLGEGTVFKLTHNSDGTWTESVLYSFHGTDAANPAGPLVFDAAGNLWGVAGGGEFDHGAIFKLTPSGGGNWTESLVYSFGGALDGGQPSGGLVLDSAGNLYGTAAYGGYYPTCSDSPNCGGVVYELTP